MYILAAVLSAALILGVLWDSFEAIVLPRRVTRRFRLTRWFYRTSWRVWSLVGRGICEGKRYQAYLSYYGPLSMLFLLALWALGLVAGFGALHWALGSTFFAVDHQTGVWTDLYMSGTTFFTLGIGDVTPRTPLARVLTVTEAGLGFGFLAVVIGYLPVFYQSFSRREVQISLLDSRAGSPPSGVELIERHADEEGLSELADLLREWERWSAELLESHLSYPVLCYFRSQHDRQSWLASLTAILDACAILLAGQRECPRRQARLTFAMARHAIVDLCQVMSTAPRPPEPERLPSDQERRVHQQLEVAGVPLGPLDEFGPALAEYRRLYEPYVNALSGYLAMPLPPWLRAAPAVANWRTSAWDRAHQELS